jgi:hypothetical protein
MIAVGVQFVIDHTQRWTQRNGAGARSITTRTNGRGLRNSHIRGTSSDLRGSYAHRIANRDGEKFVSTMILELGGTGLPEAPVSGGPQTVASVCPALHAARRACIAGVWVGLRLADAAPRAQPREKKRERSGEAGTGSNVPRWPHRRLPRSQTIQATPLLPGSLVRCRCTAAASGSAWSTAST